VLSWSEMVLRLLTRACLAVAGVCVVSNVALAEEASYGLDMVRRELRGTGEFRCPEIDLVVHRGETVRYSNLIRVYRGFRDRLVEFERVARDVGIEVYGRPPRRVAILGGYSCRRMRSHPHWLSEHALGNAIDVEGFDFDRLPKDAKLPAGLPAAFINGFEVRVIRHWSKKTGHAAVHARFLRLLAQRLIERDDVFRVLLGPGYPGHANHFHFDMAPFRLVQIFEDGQPLHAGRAGSSPAGAKPPEHGAAGH
jgi:hypothetical protein